MQYVFVIFFALSLVPLQATSSPGKIVKETIDVNGKERSYYLFVPKTVSASDQAPLLVTLHGSGSDGRSLVEEWKDLAGKEGIIILGPNALSTTGWSLQEDGPGFLHEVIEAIKAKLPINPRRVYLFGYSAGAVYALQLSMLESEYFAATSVFAGAMPQSSYPRIDKAKRKIPISIFAGTDDPFFPIATVRATRDALKGRGFLVQLKEIWENDSGNDHAYRPVAYAVNRDSWKFLKNHQLDADPRYTPYAIERQ